jgi:[ribosomal protein S18]-alanine N-acetyltransferase
MDVRALSERDAAAISRWHYEEPYEVYDMEGDASGLLDGAYYALVDARGDLVGYCCFGAEAQVPGGREASAYDDAEALDVGMGVRPDLTGAGQGRDFLRAVLAFAQRQFAPAALRVTIAAWNQRARRLCERAGFHPAQTFTSSTPHGEWEFAVMTRRCHAENTGNEQAPEGCLPGGRAAGRPG